MAVLTITSPSKDTTLEQANPTTNYGSLTRNTITSQNSSRNKRALISFSIKWGTDIPNDATITAATLKYISVRFLQCQW
jgi:hypothetical protein